MSHIICMKKVFISFMALLFLLVSHAGAEETLEERKQRIMRKYLRERIDIVSSGLTVDTGEIDDESVKDSEMMQVEDLEFERHEGGVVMPPPRQAPRLLQSIGLCLVCPERSGSRTIEVSWKRMNCKKAGNVKIFLDCAHRKKVCSRNALL